MSGQQLIETLRRKAAQISDGHGWLFSEMVQHINDDGEFWPGTNLLAKACCRDPNTVRTRLTDLAAANVIRDTGKRRGGNGKVPVWTLGTAGSDASAGDGAAEVPDQSRGNPNGIQTESRLNPDGIQTESSRSAVPLDDPYEMEVEMEEELGSASPNLGRLRAKRGTPVVVDAWKSTAKSAPPLDVRKFGSNVKGVLRDLREQYGDDLAVMPDDEWERLLATARYLGREGRLGVGTAFFGSDGKPPLLSPDGGWQVTDDGTLYGWQSSW